MNTICKVLVQLLGLNEQVGAPCQMSDKAPTMATRTIYSSLRPVVFKFLLILEQALFIQPFNNI